MTNLPQGWEVKTLSEIGEIITGSTPSKSNVEFYGKDYPFFKPSDFEQGYFLENAGDNLSKLGFGKARQLPPKTILVVCIGSLGKVALTRVIGSCNQQINAIIPHKNIISEYIYYYCISSKFQSILFSKAPQTTLAIFNKTEFSKLEIIYPKDIKKQERIVGILDESFAKIDESIKILEQNLLNLDELMQSALQKAFNPLKDNAKENYKLPQGWEWKSLEEISENISAGGDKPKNCTESKTAKNQIPVYANGVNNNGLVGYTDKATIIKPSLTISARGTIGFVCIRKEPYFPIVRLISLIPCENILCLHYLYFCLNFFIAKGEGSSIPQLTIPKFKSLQIPLPPLKEQEQIAEHLDFVFEKAKALKELYTKELKDYEELKQSLLNKAFKGEL
ncbi:restriction endonuclease subunit S [Campylobacter jejuni]|uniref:restriction endonuclease subunit S n=1 Tax=Campylobacter jejuni TaxID=197 RepID=UPI00126BD216|nr:restriction endonuclease subunit S [Campylobacter jejuni]EAI5011513.1 restriction endonuclease subunit S [Campylobacter jejuni]EAI6535546.1 restriction endonuclease subunit S [Campylobacter jejuni]EAJ0042237.1 restriction endonuclease subunit S [Campylobacter jejuni]EAJ8250350.1 restriction endonuclease subunit S [Campylobacter jejuni]EAJ8578306.1 restriction endonuclease subunit S [Campylobacter jejuni]